MKINELIASRETTLSSVDKIKAELTGMENQLNDLPFYAEYVEKKAQLNNAEKSLKGYDKDIFDKMTEENLDKVNSENHIYHIKTSTKASIKVTDEALLPEEAFEKKVVSKTQLGKLIFKAEAAGETFPWAEQTFNKSLEVI